jgi:hypothetical protein
VLATTRVSHIPDRNSVNSYARAPGDESNSDDGCACSSAESLVDVHRGSIMTMRNVDAVCAHDRTMNLQ